jgi:hypothetical protein
MPAGFLTLSLRRFGMRRILAITTTMLVVFGIGGTTASAGARSTERIPTIARDLVVPATSSGAQAACPVPAEFNYGYYGEAMCGTHILQVDWYGDGSRLETFVISPVRTIWHAWPGSGGWYEMPGSGLADDTGFGWWEGGDRVVAVWVNNSGWWCNRDPAGAAGWQGWYFC